MSTPELSSQLPAHFTIDFSPLLKKPDLESEDSVAVSLNDLAEISSNIRKANSGIHCINKLLLDGLNGDSSELLNCFAHDSSTKGTLHGAIDLLSDIVSVNEQKLFEIYRAGEAGE